MYPLVHNLPHFLYHAAQVRELDRISIEEEGIPGIELMERAGRAAFAVLRRRWPRARSVGVWCGTGNNGGDGFVVARLAHEAGYDVRVWQLGDVARIGGDALIARQCMEAVGVSTEVFTGSEPVAQAVLVDGLLGTGLNSEISGLWREAINVLNTAHKQGSQVLALDIPSGLHADTGRVLGLAVQADCCVTFIGLKLGLFTGQGSALCGEIIFDGLGVPAQVFERFAPVATRLTCFDAAVALPRRRATAHKGDFGHVLVVGGDHGMSGALCLAGEAALRVGAGLVSAATRAIHAPAISAVRPELMCHAVEPEMEPEMEQNVVQSTMLASLLDRASVVAVGPGLGQGKWARSLFSAVLERHLPMVVDADALNLLAADPVQRMDWILTPHPGEAARLLGQDIDAVQADRMAAASEIQHRYGGVVVLKGAGTIVVDAEGEMGICSAGNPGMASGGMGDVLTGVIAGLIAQGLPLAGAARLGVCLHATAADRAARKGQRGLLASDLFPELRYLLE